MNVLEQHLLELDRIAAETTTNGVDTDDLQGCERQGALRILWQHRELVSSLIYRDIRGRYKQSVLGIVWALLQPLAMTAVFTVVMSKIAKMPTGGIPYPVFAYVTMLPWLFFASALSTSTECLVGNFNLITKIYFPREVFPIAAVLGKTVDLGLGILVLIPLFFVFHVAVSWWALITIPVLILQICCLFGLSFLFSSANLFYRDVRHVMPLLTQVWMYSLPIIYGLDVVPQQYMRLYSMNPMLGIMDSYRRCTVQGQPPLWNNLAYSAVFSVLIMLIGYWTFKRLEPKFAETI